MVRDVILLSLEDQWSVSSCFRQGEHTGCMGIFQRIKKMTVTRRGLHQGYLNLQMLGPPVATDALCLWRYYEELCRVFLVLQWTRNAPRNGHRSFLKVKPRYNLHWSICWWRFLWLPWSQYELGGKFNKLNRHSIITDGMLSFMLHPWTQK